MGYNVCDAASVADEVGCVSNHEVDIQCLYQKGDFSGCDLAQSHFSHYLSCDLIIILEASDDTLESRLKKRGYTDLKIRENIDAQLSGTIYYESLERLPAVRIKTMDTTSASPESLAREIAAMLEPNRKK